MTYKIKLEIFEGPLDLLLYLIKRDHLNIYDIPIAKVAEQYLGYLELMQLLDLSIAGEFLVMAATLMQIKSKMLLPPDEAAAEAEEADPRAELVQKLLEYKKFKEAAHFLEDKESFQGKLFRRPALPGQAESETEIVFGTTLFDLLNAFSRALANMPKTAFREIIDDEFTIEGKIHDLLHLVLARKIVSLWDLFSAAKNRHEIIVTFLAVLELMRQKEIVGAQSGVFGEITIMLNEDRMLPPQEQSRR
ncbi:MAG: segregation/condensation protein A [Candidatus Omnitrophica bacterium]|nr:segregation/condensation protein A [Candidatus Omnitrophota bacterium]